MTGYTPSQAAAVTGLPLAAVHKTIDSRLIRPQRTRSGGTVRRLLTKEQLIFLQLEAEGVRRLPLKMRRAIAESIRLAPNTRRLAVASAPMIIEVAPARRRVESRLKEIAHIEEMVVRDPEVMRGTPVFRCTRIPVYLVSDMLSQGASVEEILDGYPALSREKILAAPLYMRLHPRRGRPIRLPWHGQMPVKVSSGPLGSVFRRQ